jgi:hypothetical protein
MLAGRWLVFAIAAVTLFADEARADNRVALVIGNGAYQKVPALPNPMNDAGDIASSFERLGFKVQRLSNATFDDMRRGLLEFGRQARSSDMAVVYFAGHGMELGGENWLIPVDAELRADTDAENEAISLRTTMLQVAGAHSLGLVILDACRNNPFAAKMQRSIRTRAVDRGLVRTEPTDNVLVAYAAKDGTTANDGSGRNSPFTAALLNNLEKPGLEVTFLFRNVRDEVMNATKREQQPFVYGSLSKAAIYLKELPPPVAAAPSTVSAMNPDEVLWETIRESRVPGLFEEFLRRFPNSGHAAEARTRHSEARNSAEQAAAASSLPQGGPAQPRVVLQSPSEGSHLATGDSQAGGLYTQEDAKRVAAIASGHNIPLPEFLIHRPDKSVSAEVRKFVGIWATKVAFAAGQGRHVVLVVTAVDTSRRVTGFYAFGPPTPRTINQNPANAFPFAGEIEGGTLRFESGRAAWSAKFTAGDSLHVTQRLKNDARMPSAVLEPVWRLVERERTAGR